MRYIWGGMAPSRSEAQEKIDSFAALPDGWHYGGGVSPSKDTRDLSTFVLEKMQLLGLATPHIAAGPEGEILLAATSGDDYFSITVEADGCIIFNHERSDVEVEYAEGLNPEGVVRRLISATEALWNISGLSIQVGSIANDASSTIWHLNDLPTAECQSWNLNAPQPQVA